MGKHTATKPVAYCTDCQRDTKSADLHQAMTGHRVIMTGETR